MTDYIAVLMQPALSSCADRRPAGLQATPPVRPMHWWTACTLLCCALALALPALQLPLHYHDFADQRVWFGLPHAHDVLSNGAFAVWGAALLGALRRAAPRLPAPAVLALRVLGWGFVLTAACSALYHLHPHNTGLALDRAGMVLAFAGMLAVLAADRLPDMHIPSLLQGALLLGLAAVLAAWLRGNMTPWVMFQLGGMALIALTTLLATPRRAGRAGGRNATLGVAWGAVLLWYVAAKLCELYDHQLLHWSAGWVSGHTLKHLVAACALWPVWAALRRLEG